MSFVEDVKEFLASAGLSPEEEKEFAEIAAEIDAYEEQFEE